MENKGSPFSLSLRVLAFVSVTILLSHWLIYQLVIRSIQEHFIHMDREELAVISAAVSNTLKKALESNDLSILKHAVTGHHGVHYRIINEENIIIFQSDGKFLVSLAPNIDQNRIHEHAPTFEWQNDQISYRGIISKTTINNKIYHIVSAMEMTIHMEFLSSFEKSIIWILSGTGLLTLFAAWLGIHQAHGPIRSLSEKIRNVQTNRLDLRVQAQDFPKELHELVKSFNTMVQELESGFKRLSNFSADIAHELRTPLTNIITQTQVGLQKNRTLGEYRDLLYSALEEQERLAKMVNDMLWLAKSENGLIRPSAVEIDLTKEVKALFEYFESVLDEKGITFNVSDKTLKISGDRELLRRALANLLSNAIRHTPEGGNITVIINETSERAVKIEVSNTGSGITAEHLSRIFDRFYRIDPSRQRHSEGAGLGLAIVKSIINAHEGTVHAESNSGTTTFIVALPKHQKM